MVEGLGMDNALQEVFRMDISVRNTDGFTVLRELEWLVFFSVKFLHG